MNFFVENPKFFQGYHVRKLQRSLDHFDTITFSSRFHRLAVNGIWLKIKVLEILVFTFMPCNGKNFICKTVMFENSKRFVSYIYLKFLLIQRNLYSAINIQEIISSSKILFSLIIRFHHVYLKFEFMSRLFKISERLKMLI